MAHIPKPWDIPNLGYPDTKSGFRGLGFRSIESSTVIIKKVKDGKTKSHEP